MFLLDGATIFAPAVLERMVEAFDGHVDILTPARETSHGYRGIALVSPRVMRLIAEALDREGSKGWEDLMRTSGDHRRSVLDLSDEYAYILDTSSLPANEAERQLYRSLGKSTDTIVIRETRKAAALVVRALVETKATPNHLTLLSFFLGMAAAFLLWKAGYTNVLAGAFLLVLSYVIDLADGMLARIKLLESKGGGWLDFVLDNVVHLGIFAGLTRIVYLRSPGWQVLSFGILFIGGTLLSGLAFTIYMIVPKGRNGWPGGAKNIDWVLEGVVEAIRHRDFSFLFLLLAAVNRIHWFFWVGAIGANLFWPIVLYVALRRRARARQLSEKEQGLRP
ncbi:MAG: CDP-alcohol phosphatidyltransferase family protein [candidate division NC10 bacterium]|nr:CDP-alcohol phosphatidyltransferase family protein [candidate division NC10 bacterium]